eukprot:c12413_g1_i1 orf=508-3432(-)
MAEETKRKICSYCDSQHTDFDYALHKASNGHVKKVQRSLFERGFASVCLVCNFALKDLKHVELHVQEKTHTDRMKSFLVDSYLSNDKCTCGSCGITFFNEVVLEAHRFLPLHGATTAGPHDTPKLNELSRQLTGLCGKQFMSNGIPLCSICNVTFDCIEDLITHLFTSAHVSRLRSSFCMVCKKDFTHASDRESHLNSSKHQVTLQKCANLLEEVRTQTLLSKRGYPCMFCMIWCNSWLCLEIHVLDKHHTRVSVESKSNRQISSQMIFLAVSEGIKQCVSCDESAMRSWREWRGAASGECVWCHRCGVTLLNVDEANRHLNSHVVEGCQITSRSHSSKVLDLVSLPESFECNVCAMSFKSTFMLSLHEAGFEHHSRLAACLKSDACCSNCGLLMCDEGDSDGVFVGTDIKATLSQVNDIEASPRCLHAPPNNSVVCDMVEEISHGRVMQAMSSSKGTTHQSPAFVATHEIFSNGDEVCTDRIEANGTLVANGRRQADSKEDSMKVGLALGAGGELPVFTSGKALGIRECIDRLSMDRMKQSTLTVSTHYDDHVTSDAGGIGFSMKVAAGKSGRIPTNLVADGNNILAGKRCWTSSNAASDGNGFEPDKANSMDRKGLQGEVPLSNKVANSPTVRGDLPLACGGLDDSFMRNNPVLLAGQVPDGSGGQLAKIAQYADFGIPVVVAATLAPLGTVQESLQSITAIVTETLSSALVSFYKQQSASLSKRKSQCGAEEDTVDQPDGKRMCSERILEAALQQGLQSANLNATRLQGFDIKSQDFAEKENGRHSIGNDKNIQEPKAVIAVAASVIPNGVPDLSRLAGGQGQEVAAKAQGSFAVQSADDSSKQAQESTDMKSESLSQVIVGDQGSAGRTRVKTVVEEKPTQLEIPPLQPSSVLVCRGTQNFNTSTPNDAVNSVKDEPAKKLAAPTGVVMSRDAEESESNDDDYYAFLDPTRTQAKWWSSSDSEDSGSVSK